MQDLSWAAGKKSMGNVDAFLRSLLTFNKDAIPLPCVEKCEKDYISNPAFNAANIRTKSGAAAGLCGWVINICKYFRIYQVRPLHLHGACNHRQFRTYPVNASCLRSMRNNVVLLLSYQEVSSSKPKSFPLNAGGGTQACRLGGGKQEAE